MIIRLQLVITTPNVFGFSGSTPRAGQIDPVESVSINSQSRSHIVDKYFVRSLSVRQHYQ